MKNKPIQIKTSSLNNLDKSRFFENLLFIICIISFFLLLTVQVVLVLPEVRNGLNLSDKSIGLPLRNDEYLYKKGQLTLEMVGIEPDPTVSILINGDAVAMFEKLKMDIIVKEGDVVEIDGSSSLVEHIITVKSSTTNINSKCYTAVAKVESNIEKLLKVQFND